VQIKGNFSIPITLKPAAGKTPNAFQFFSNSGPISWIHFTLLRRKRLWKLQRICSRYDLIDYVVSQQCKRCEDIGGFTWSATSTTDSALNLQQCTEAELLASGFECSLRSRDAYSYREGWLQLATIFVHETDQGTNLIFCPDSHAEMSKKTPQEAKFSFSQSKAIQHFK
jgi:hypothetical protein